jgi:hypothetical protein
LSRRSYAAQRGVSEAAMRKTISTEHVYAWGLESNFALCYLAMKPPAVSPRALFAA